MKCPSEVITQALFDWGGSGQGMDDMLAEIAASQASAITKALKDAGYIIVRDDAIRLAQAHAREDADNDNRRDTRRKVHIQP